MYVLQSRAFRSRCSIPGTWYGTCKHPTDYKSEVRGSVSRVKTPCEQGLPHCTYVLQADTTPILPDAAHDSRNQGRVVSLSVLSLLSACVRFRQLREVHQSLQQALNSWSQTQSAATDGSLACCTSSLMLRVCVMLRVLPSQSPVRPLLVLMLYK